MINRCFDRLQYIGSHHYILDRILKNAFDYFILTSSTKPTLNYEFVNEVVSVSLKNGTYRVTLRRSPSLHNAMWTSRHTHIYIYIDL